MAERASLIRPTCWPARIDGSLASKRRDAAIAPYGPCPRMPTAAVRVGRARKTSAPLPTLGLLPYKREPRQTIGVRLERNESALRSNGTDITPPTLPVSFPAKVGNDTAVESIRAIMRYLTKVKSPSTAMRDRLARFLLSALIPIGVGIGSANAFPSTLNEPAEVTVAEDVKITEADIDERVSQFSWDRDRSEVTTALRSWPDPIRECMPSIVRSVRDGVCFTKIETYFEQLSRRFPMVVDVQFKVSSQLENGNGAKEFRHGSMPLESLCLQFLSFEARHHRKYKPVRRDGRAPVGFC